MTIKETYLKHLSPQEIVTIGDSPNDENLFNRDLFPLSVGVNNILKYTDKLKYQPAYVTNLTEIDGFCELNRIIT